MLPEFYTLLPGFILFLFETPQMSISLSLSYFAPKKYAVINMNLSWPAVPSLDRSLRKQVRLFRCWRVSGIFIEWYLFTWNKICITFLLILMLFSMTGTAAGGNEGFWNVPRTWLWCCCIWRGAVSPRNGLDHGDS